MRAEPKITFLASHRPEEFETSRGSEWERREVGSETMFSYSGDELVALSKPTNYYGSD